MWKDDATAADILLAAQDIQQFAAGLTRDKFASDKFAQSAVIFKIIVLGEAAKRLSDEFRLQKSTGSKLQACAIAAFTDTMTSTSA